MLRQPYWVDQPFHCLETGVSAGIGTTSEEQFGLYQESDPDGALRVTGLRRSLGLLEALSANQDGKAVALIVHSNPCPDHRRPTHRLDSSFCEPEGGYSPHLVAGLLLSANVKDNERSRGAKRTRGGL